MYSLRLIVADDLTRATDTGHEFAGRGLRTLVSTLDASTADADTRTDVRVVDTDSRYAASSDAAARVERVISEKDAAFVYKKVDSTLRGNLVAEVDAALEATGADVTLVAPASPRNGRTTVEGYHLVGGGVVPDRSPAGEPRRGRRDSSRRGPRRDGRQGSSGRRRRRLARTPPRSGGGEGVASETSMVDAIRVAATAVENRRENEQ